MRFASGSRATGALVFTRAAAMTACGGAIAALLALGCGSGPSSTTPRPDHGLGPRRVRVRLGIGRRDGILVERRLRIEWRDGNPRRAAAPDRVAGRNLRRAAAPGRAAGRHLRRAAAPDRAAAGSAAVPLRATPPRRCAARSSVVWGAALPAVALPAVAWRAAAWPAAALRGEDWAVAERPPRARRRASAREVRRFRARTPPIARMEKCAASPLVAAGGSGDSEGSGGSEGCLALVETRLPPPARNRAPWASFSFAVRTRSARRVRPARRPRWEGATAPLAAEAVERSEASVVSEASAVSEASVVPAEPEDSAGSEAWEASVVVPAEPEDSAGSEAWEASVVVPAGPADSAGASAGSEASAEPGASEGSEAVWAGVREARAAAADAACGAHGAPAHHGAAVVSTSPMDASPIACGSGACPLGERCCNPCGGTCVSATSEVACPYDSNPAIVCAGASP